MSLFITFEGPEGSGKTTQIRALASSLTAQGHTVVTTREPGGTHIGDGIRNILLDPDHHAMSPRAEALLFNAARAQLVDEVIQPALAQGVIVLCDRFADSTLAYQGYGHRQDQAALGALADFATGGLRPDLTIYLDIDPDVGLQRKQAEEWNRMEEQTAAFHRRVRAGYLALAAAAPARWVIINAGDAVESIQAQIARAVAQRLAQAAPQPPPAMTSSRDLRP